VSVHASITHIAWDWNGTLFGDGQALIDSTIDAFIAAGMPQVSRELYQLHHSQPIPLFYNKLAGRTLTAAEQQLLAQLFKEAYLKRKEDIALTRGAVEALTLWKEAGRQQSLLSMYPHDELIRLVDKEGIAGFFARIDGLVDAERDRKAPHLRFHLDQLRLSPDRVLVIGDSADDALAARECGVACLLYHAGEHALHALEHFADLQVPVVTGLRQAVADVLDGTCKFQTQRGEEVSPHTRATPL
jgi:phosphoglycolate phosphatase-like HAD superfamily hydrolase